MKTQSQVKKKRILVIEDDGDISTLVCAALQLDGFAITSAGNGLEGFYKARRERPNLIILDLNLPELPGEEVCKAIREDTDEKFACLPIIMLTAKSKESDRIVGKVIGANAYVTKPFEIDNLLSEIRRLLTDSKK